MIIINIIIIIIIIIIIMIIIIIIIIIIINRNHLISNVLVLNVDQTAMKFAKLNSWEEHRQHLNDDFNLTIRITYF